MNFRGLRNIEAAFFIPAWFVPPSIRRAGCAMLCYSVKTYGAPFVKILYLTDLAQKLLSLAEIAISACRDVISGRDSYLCMQRCYLWQR